MAIRNIFRISALLLPLVLVMFALGWWQTQRMAEKVALTSEFEDAQYNSLDESLGNEARYTHINATGRFDTEKHIFLDNMIWNGRAGVHVFTPFRTFSGTTILVNRGWKPMAADRASLPAVWTPAVPVDIRGILAPPPEHRQKLGSPDALETGHWPQLVTYLDISTVAAALQTPLPDRVVWLDSEDPAGFEGRDWSPSTMTADHHQAYAIQWFALGAAALVFWLVLAWRARRGHE